MNPIHLHSEHPVTRNQISTRLYTLSEEDMPKGNGLPKDLLTIAKYLNPALSQRYGHTFVNGLIYVYDFCYLAGAYIPRVWWKNVVNPDPQRIIDMNIQSTYEWFIDFGHEFGWREVSDTRHAQELAEIGHVVVIIASPKKPSYTGGISIVLPEDKTVFNPHAKDNTIPYQTSSGKLYYRTDWYKGKRNKEFKIYVNYMK